MSGVMLGILREGENRALETNPWISTLLGKPIAQLHSLIPEGNRNL